MDVNPDTVTGLLADGGDAELTIPIITAMARAYTRGHGFHPDGTPYDDVAAVITTATARFMTNPGQASQSMVAGAFTSDMRSRGFEGWTLAEQIVLNRYRKRAM